MKFFASLFIVMIIMIACQSLGVYWGFYSTQEAITLVWYYFLGYCVAWAVKDE